VVQLSISAVMIKRFKYYICERDLISIAQGRIQHVHFYARKPKECIDSYCDINSFLEVVMNITNPNKDDENKSPKQRVGNNRKKRSSAQPNVPKLPRNSTTGRSKNTR
jgi:hypothetical protein